MNIEVGNIYTLYNNVYNNKKINNLKSQYFIFKTDTIYSEGKYFCKVFIFNRFFDSDIPEYLCFRFKDEIEEYRIVKFVEVSEFKNSNVFGCLLVFEYDITHKINTIIISQIKNKRGLFSFEKHTPTNIGYINPDSIEKIEYINRYFNNKFLIYPKNFGNYWLCECANLNIDEKCDSCGKNRIDIFKEYEFDIDTYIFDQYFNSLEFKVDTRKSFDENLEINFRDLSIINYLKHINLKQKEDLKKLYDLFIKNAINEYKKSNKIIFDLALTFDLNIQIYKKGINIYNDINNTIFTESEMSDLRRDYDTKLKSTQRKSKKYFNIAIVFILMSLTLYLVLDNTILKNNRYNEAISAVDDGNITYSIVNQLKKFGNYKEAAKYSSIAEEYIQESLIEFNQIYDELLSKDSYDKRALLNQVKDYEFILFNYSDEVNQIIEEIRLARKWSGGWRVVEQITNPISDYSIFIDFFTNKITYVYTGDDAIHDSDLRNYTDNFALKDDVSIIILNSNFKFSGFGNDRNLFVLEQSDLIRVYDYRSDNSKWDILDFTR